MYVLVTDRHGRLPVTAATTADAFLNLTGIQPHPPIYMLSRLLWVTSAMAMYRDSSQDCGLQSLDYLLWVFTEKRFPSSDDMEMLVDGHCLCV